MLLTDARRDGGATSSSSSSRSLVQRARRLLRQVGFFVATAATACWRRGPRGCWATVVRVGGLPLEWLPIESSRRRLSSSMDFLEQFRRGPETQSEWNLLLWRITFPMIALVIFTLLAVLGKFGHRIYSFLVCPVWYFSQFVLVAHPFLLVFKFHESDASIRKRIWQVLAVLSVAISLMEWFLSSPPDAAPSRRSTTRLGPSAAVSASLRARFLRHSWVVANTVFGIVALVAIPRYFYLQRRIVVRDNYETLTTSPSATTLFIPVSPVSTPRSTSSGHGDLFREDALLSPTAAPAATTTPPPLMHATSTTPPSSTRGTPPGSSSGRTHASIVVSSSSSPAVSSLAALKRRSRAVFLLTASSALLVWIAMVSSYSSIKPIEVISKYWFTIYLFSPVVCALLIYVLRGQAIAVSANPSSSFDFVAIYSVLIVHLPVFLGHLCFRLFTLVELADPAHPAHAEARGIDFASTGSGSGVSFSASTSWMKLGISIVFLLVMQTYFYAMTQVVNAMAEPFAHPSLLYLGQLYYYLFWYVLVGSDTPIDALYWGMLLVNNVHIAFLNTGIYADVKQSSTSCFSTPVFANSLSMFKGSSMAMCFRATTLTMANVTSGRAALYRPPSHSSGLRMLEFERESSARSGLSVSGSDPEEAEFEDSGITVHQASRRHTATATTPTVNQSALYGDSAPKSNRGKLTRSWSSMLRVPSRSILAFGGGASTAAAAAQGSNLPSSSAMIYFTQCSCSGPQGVHSSSCAESSERSAPTPPVYKSSAHMEQLRPLYFLMKLAEQDNMADTTALILVPSLLTLLAVLDKPSHGFAIIADQLNLWVRCVFMFAGRMAGAYLAREIFAYKLRSRLRQQSSSARRNRATDDAVLSDSEGVSTRMWIQRLMLQDFHRHFWYLTVVTIVVTFACFERVEVPARFALLT